MSYRGSMSRSIRAPEKGTALKILLEIRKATYQLAAKVQNIEDDRLPTMTELQRWGEDKDTGAWIIPTSRACCGIELEEKITMIYIINNNTTTTSEG